MKYVCKFILAAALAVLSVCPSVAGIAGPPSDLRVAPFVQSKWEQPVVVETYPCGPAATAQAQAMRFFGWPVASVVAQTFECNVRGLGYVDLMMQGGTYNWSQMPLQYNAANDSVTALCRDVSISLETAYKASSAAYASKAAESLVGTFGYSGAVYRYSGAGLARDDYLKCLIPNLDAKRPALLCIHKQATGSTKANTGHVAVADGYGYENGELYIHLNMGRQGVDDGWYKPDEIDASDNTYHSIVCATFNIFTTEQQYSTIASGRILDDDGNPVSGAIVTARYNDVVAATATSDANGIYALVLPPSDAVRNYAVDATCENYRSMGGITVSASKMAANLSDQAFHEIPAASGNGNSYGNDFAIWALLKPVVEAPDSPNPVVFLPPTNVTLTCATDGASIYYTLDGSTPTSASTFYDGPFALTRSTTVKARAYKEGCRESAVFSMRFVCTPVSAYAQYARPEDASRLLLHLDAIENAGVGVHEAAPATWTDLSGKLTMTRTGNAAFAGDAYVADGSTSGFTATSSAVQNALSGSGAAFTLELVISHPPQQNEFENWAYVGRFEKRALIVDLRRGDSQNPLVQGVQYRSDGWQSVCVVPKGSKTSWDRRTYVAVTCNDNMATAYCEATNAFHSVIGSAQPDSNAVGIGISAQLENPLAAGAEICAVRMTARVLDEGERLRNFYIDSQRFGLADAPDGFRFSPDGALQVRLSNGTEGFRFSTDGGTTWTTGEVWADIDREMTLEARLTADASSPVAFFAVPDGASATDNSVTFTPTHPLAITATASVWRDNDGTGSFESAANWASGAVPLSGDFCMLVSGDAEIRVGAAHTLGDMVVRGAGRATFSGEGRVSVGLLAVNSGMTVATGGKLAVAGIVGAGNVVISPNADNDVATLSLETAMTGGLTIDAARPMSFNVDAATSVRTFTVNAATDCAVTMRRTAAFVSQEAVVEHGILRQGGDMALGDTQKLTVRNGGTFDVNAKKVREEMPVHISGAGAGGCPYALCTPGAMPNYIYDLYLDGDATIGGGGRFMFGRSNRNSFIYLNRYTLTAKSPLTLRCINTMAGNIDLQCDMTLTAYNNLNRQSAYRGTTLVVHEGYTVSNNTDREVDISYLRMYGGTIGYGSAARDFGVWNELRGYGTIRRLAMGSGAKYYPDGEHYLHVTEALPASLMVDLSGLDLSARKKIPLLKVPASLGSAANAALATIRNSPPAGWSFAVRTVGGDIHYHLMKNEFSITIR